MAVLRPVRHLVATALTSALLTSYALPAAAQSADDKAAAEVLFQDGLKLLAAGKLDEACPKLAESLRLDTGIGTMMYLAECYERSGKIASAWAQFREAEASAAAKEGDARGKIARERADRLEPKLSRLAIVVPPSSDLPNLVVTRDGTPIGRPIWGTEAPIDPGRHIIRVTADGYEPRELAIEIRGEASRERIEIPALVPVPVVVAPVTPPTVAPASDRGATQRAIGITLAAVGLIGVGVGTVFGVRAMGTLSDSDERCDPQTCDDTGLALREDARSQATVSTAFFIAGGLFLGTGAVLFFTAPRATKPTAAVGSRATALPRLVVVPTASPQGAGLGATLRF
ncbi:MAG: hypothetical protein JST00_18750 [Deltaproteobacteria bacterium]|nr:hypothetical protein [Deltaproteobacteria bacterium]